MSRCTSQEPNAAISNKLELELSIYPTVFRDQLLDWIFMKIYVSSKTMTFGS